MLGNLSASFHTAATWLMPTAANITVQMVSRDPRVRKILYGSTLTALGIGLVVRSGIPKKLKSWTYKTAPQESVSMTAIRCGTAAMGLFALGYGVYSLSTGILELTQPHEVVMYGTPHGKPSKASVDSKSCQQRVQEAKKQLLSCPEAKKLWDEVKSEGPFRLKCAANQELPTGCEARLWDREIRFAKDSTKIPQDLLFELNNLKQAEPALNLIVNMCDLNADDYSRSMEEMEYQNSKNDYLISQKCIKDGYFPKDYYTRMPLIDPKTSEWIPFKKYLSQLEKTPHPDLYRKFWYEQCNPKGLAAFLEKVRLKNLPNEL